VPDLTLLENVLVVGALVQRDGPALRQQARELLRALGVDALADRLPAQLSGGEQQRGALARALVNAPAVLFADEPTGALDSSTGARLLACLDQVHAAGQTIVLATHDLAAARRADRVVLMRDGALVDELGLCGVRAEDRDPVLRDWLARRGW
jgi:putative ABC transport system ATP-binding protein